MGSSLSPKWVHRACALSHLVTGNCFREKSLRIERSWGHLVLLGSEGRSTGENALELVLYELVVILVPV